MTHNSNAVHLGSISVIQQINHISCRRRKVPPQAPLCIPRVWVPTCCTPYHHATHWAQASQRIPRGWCSVWCRWRLQHWQGSFWQCQTRFDYCWLPSKLSSLQYQFSHFFHTSFQADSSFVSKLSLKFPGYCLIHWWCLFLFNTISWGLMVTFISNMIN